MGEQQRQLPRAPAGRESQTDPDHSQGPQGVPQETFSMSPKSLSPALSPTDVRQGAAAVKRHAMIVSLYEELERLESGLLAPVASASTSRLQPPAPARSGSPRRTHSRRPSRAPSLARCIRRCSSKGL